ncbi:MAG: CapA family protein [Kofleriaceae bacterium]
MRTSSIVSGCLWLACSGVAGPGAPAADPAPVAKPKPAPPAKLTCAAGVPAEACTSPGLRLCATGDKDRVGEWRYALIGSLYEPSAGLTEAELARALRDGKPAIAASAETRAALSLTGKLGELAPDARPEVTAKAWAIVPAHQLTAAWKIIPIAGQHPLSAAPTTLVAPLCGTAKTKVRNIDPDRVTTIVMSGTTAMTRGMAIRMDHKGVTYPTQAVKPWFIASDYVHISNEVSFKPKCNAGESKTTMSFCSKNNYIEMLEDVKTNIIELTGSHLQDQGRQWIPYTIDMYEKRGWVWFGGGRNQIEATEPRLVESKGNKLAFVGCNKPWTDRKTIRDDGPGVAACDWDRMRWQIHDLRRRGYVPIVSIQHDENYKHVPPSSVVRDLRRIAEAGPAFVQGSQAHCAHPWEMHYGAYVHYGGGNIFFDLSMEPLRDATTNKLYIHANKLLAVEHLYTRLEDASRPRPLSPRERGQFLGELARALGQLRRGNPLAEPVHPEPSRTRPDSFVAGGINQTLAITVPASFDPKQRYPLIVDLDGTAGDKPEAFVVTRSGKTRPGAPAITKFVVAKYPIDPKRVTVNGR